MKFLLFTLLTSTNTWAADFIPTHICRKVAWPGDLNSKIAIADSAFEMALTQRSVTLKGVIKNRPTQRTPGMEVPIQIQSEFGKSTHTVDYWKELQARRAQLASLHDPMVDQLLSETDFSQHPARLQTQKLELQGSPNQFTLQMDETPNGYAPQIPPTRIHHYQWDAARKSLTVAFLRKSKDSLEHPEVQFKMNCELSKDSRSNTNQN